MLLSCSKQIHIQSLSVVELRLNELPFCAMLNGELLRCACRHARGHVLYVSRASAFPRRMAGT